MAKERPQLSVDELHRVRWLLGGLLALVAIWSVAFLDLNAWALIGLGTVAAGLVLVKPNLPAYFPRWTHRLAFPLVAGIFVFDYYAFNEVLPALVRLGMLLLCYRVSTYRKRRDDLQLVVLALFLVVTTGVLTVSIFFTGQIILSAGLSLGLLFTRTLVDAGEPSAAGELTERGAPAWSQGPWSPLWKRLWQVSDWRLAGAGSVLFAGLVSLSGLLFLAIPRFQLENSVFLDRWMNKHSVTGFSDVLRFGEISDIEKDESVAMRIEVSNPKELPVEMYWRMTVLDEYRDSTFRLSAAVKERYFSREMTRGQITAFGLPAKLGEGSWTFYVEPGISRFLPLAGGFSHLTFTEPQSFRLSDNLRIIMLVRDPATMKAYRVDRMDTSGLQMSPRIKNAAGTDERWVPASTRDLPFDARDRSRWQALAAEIDSGRNLGSVDFTRAAIAWLHRHHGYSLRSKIPPGLSDPLLRWTISDQPGHCELFAGAFTMLARAHGFSTRIVAGFLGGDWNGDYLMVRNSSAHAWCELLAEQGGWVRVDPTIPPADQPDQTIDKNELLRSHLHIDQGWGARWDRVRMLWYRHIVNFDFSDQVDLVRSLQTQTNSSGQRFRAVFNDAIKVFRRWVAGPWNVARLKRTSEIGAFVLVGALGLFRLWRSLRRTEWFARRRKADPIRAEAGRWMQRVDSEEPVQIALMRLRYGRRETWPNPEAIFRAARRAAKTRPRRKLVP